MKRRRQCCCSSLMPSGEPAATLLAVLMLSPFVSKMEHAFVLRRARAVVCSQERQGCIAAPINAAVGSVCACNSLTVT
jgi:hypothetical protein